MRAIGLLVAILSLLGASGLAQTVGTEPYKIGVTFPLTGPLTTSGTQYVPAAEVAVSHVNRAGGIHGHPLQLVVEDSLGTPEGGIAAMRKLVQVDGVQDHPRITRDGLVRADLHTRDLLLTSRHGATAWAPISAGSSWPD